MRLLPVLIAFMGLGAVAVEAFPQASGDSSKPAANAPKADASPPAQTGTKSESAASKSEKDLRLRFGYVSTRAVANFRSADSIEERLRAEGSTLHPQLIALRLRIEAALDEAQAALDRNDRAGANKAITRAGALLDRFAQRLGGD